MLDDRNGTIDNAKVSCSAVEEGDVAYGQLLGDFGGMHNHSQNLDCPSYSPTSPETPAWWGEEDEDEDAPVSGISEHGAGAQKEEEEDERQEEKEEVPVRGGRDNGGKGKLKETNKRGHFKPEYAKLLDAYTLQDNWRLMNVTVKSKKRTSTGTSTGRIAWTRDEDKLLIEGMKNGEDNEQIQTKITEHIFLKTKITDNYGYSVVPNRWQEINFKVAEMEKRLRKDAVKDARMEQDRARARPSYIAASPSPSAANPSDFTEDVSDFAGLESWMAAEQEKHDTEQAKLSAEQEKHDAEQKKLAAKRQMIDNAKKDYRLKAAHAKAAVTRSEVCTKAADEAEDVANASLAFPAAEVESTKKAFTATEIAVTTAQEEREALTAQIEALKAKRDELNKTIKKKVAAKIAAGEKKRIASEAMSKAEIDARNLIAEKKDEQVVESRAALKLTIEARAAYEAIIAMAGKASPAVADACHSGSVANQAVQDSGISAAEQSRKRLATTATAGPSQIRRKDKKR
jgi:chromosome segregation ATPase